MKFLAVSIKRLDQSNFVKMLRHKPKRKQNFVALWPLPTTRRTSSDFDQTFANNEEVGPVIYNTHYTQHTQENGP